MYYIVFIVSVIFVVWVGGYSHEKDLIRQCVEEGTLHTWNSDYKFKCEASENKQTHHHQPNGQ